jgi:hypothetical protein
LAEQIVKEADLALLRRDVTELLERARQACEEAQRLSSDYRFIISWRRMRPRFTVRPAFLLDGED